MSKGPEEMRLFGNAANGYSSYGAEGARRQFKGRWDLYIRRIGLTRSQAKVRRKYAQQRRFHLFGASTGLEMASRRPSKCADPTVHTRMAPLSRAPTAATSATGWCHAEAARVELGIGNGRRHQSVSRAGHALGGDRGVGVWPQQAGIANRRACRDTAAPLAFHPVHPGRCLFVSNAQAADGSKADRASQPSSIAAIPDDLAVGVARADRLGHSRGRPYAGVGDGAAPGARRFFEKIQDAQAVKADNGLSWFWVGVDSAREQYSHP